MSFQSVEASIEEMSSLTDSILRLMLQPDVYIDYQAGQYLQIVTEQGPMSFSIANAPLGLKQYELHLRYNPNNTSSQQLLAKIKRQGRVTLQLPFGECYLSRLDVFKPILFIAGGTGFAPIKAMIEQLLAAKVPRPFELFLGARSQNDLYMNDKIIQWQTNAMAFNYVTCLADINNKTLSDLVFEHHLNDLNQWQMVISGPFDMVYSTRDALIARGVQSENLFSDAFSFETK